MTGFRLIFADCPWQFGDKLRQSSVKRGAEANYSTLSVPEIAALPVESVAADDSVLCLWCPSSMLADGLHVMDRWGFIHKALGTWVKTTSSGKTAFGMGHLLRGATEHFLVGIRGSPYQHIVGPRNVRNVWETDSVDGLAGQLAARNLVWKAENEKHSKKPECVQDSFDQLFGECAKLELFARRARPGWTCIGDGIDGLDIRMALASLSASRQEPAAPEAASW